MKYTRSFFRLTLALCCVAFCVFVYALSPSHAAPQINNQINYQARLLDASGFPVADGNYSVYLSLYDASVGGTRLWTATGTTAVPTPLTVYVQNGLFTVLLGDTSLSGGSQNTLDTVDWNSDQIYLGVTINADAEMSPRKRFASAPQAFNARQLQGMYASSTASGGQTLFTFNQTENNAATGTRSTLDIRSAGTSNTNDFLLRGINDVGSVVFTVNRAGSVTSSNFFVSGLTSSTNLNANIASFATATVAGTGICLSNGQFCAPAGAEADTLASVTGRGVFTSDTLSLFGGFVAASSSVTGTLNVVGNLRTTGTLELTSLATSTGLQIRVPLSSVNDYSRGLTISTSNSSTGMVALKYRSSFPGLSDVSSYFFTDDLSDPINATGAYQAYYHNTNAYRIGLLESGAGSMSTVDLLNTNNNTANAAFEITNFAGNSSTAVLSLYNSAASSFIVQHVGSGTPEGNVYASSGSIYFDTSASVPGTLAYLKSGPGMSGWSGIATVDLLPSLADTLQSVTARGSFTTSTTQFFGGFVAASSSVTGTLNVAGASNLLQDVYVGTSTYSVSLNPLFALSGDDLYVQGNIGSVSSVYTNGAFVAGTGTTMFGNGFISHNNGAFNVSTTGDFTVDVGGNVINLGTSSAFINFAGRLFSNILPNFNNAYDIGDPGLALANIYSVNVSSTNFNTDELTVARRLSVPSRVPVTAIGSTPLSGVGSAYSLFLQGKYAYVANAGNDSLDVIDYSIPSSPTFVTSVAAGLDPISVMVDGNYAYLLNQNGDSLMIYDVTDPFNPILLSSTLTANDPVDVKIQGKFAYVFSQTASTLEVFDISNPFQVVLVGSVATIANPAAGFVQGRFAYVAGYFSGLEIFDLSNPAAPISVGATTTDSGTLDIAVQGRYAYVVNAIDNTLQIIDVVNPSSPVGVGVVSTASNPYGIAVQGRNAFVTSNGGNLLEIYDVADPTAPVNSGSVTTGLGPTGVFVQGLYAAVVANGSGNLEIFDVSDAYIQQLEVGGLAVNDLSVRGDFQGQNAFLSGGLSVARSGRFSGGLSVTGTTQLMQDTYVGASSYPGGLNPLFTMNGNDLFVQGNIGSVSSVYTNGAFVAGAASTFFGDGFVSSNQNNFTYSSVVSHDFYANSSLVATFGYDGIQLNSNKNGLGGGGDIDLNAASALPATNFNGGNISIDAGAGDGTGAGGQIDIRAGNSNSAIFTAGTVNVYGGNGQFGGQAYLNGGTGSVGFGGDTIVRGGNGNTTGGSVSITGGDGTTVGGGSIYLSPGAGLTPGSIYIQPDTALTASTNVLFREASAVDAVGLRAPTSLSGSTNFVLPFADGASSTVIGTDGSGNLSFVSVCLADGTNCASSGGGDLNWTYNLANDFARNATATSDVIIGNTALNTAPFRFEVNTTSSRFIVGQSSAGQTRADVVIGAATSSGMNSLFQLTGDDLYVAGNIGSASSVYTNGAFVAGTGSTYFGKGFIYKNDADQLAINSVSGTSFSNSISHIINNQTKFNRLSDISVSNQIDQFVVQGNKGFAISDVAFPSSESFQIYDLTNATSPTLISSVAFSGGFFGDPNYLAVSGKNAFVSLGLAGLGVIDISDIKNPKQIATHTAMFTFPPNGVAVSAERVYVSQGVNFPFGKVTVVDVTNPYAPSSTFSIDNLSFPANVRTKGNYLYFTQQQFNKYAFNIYNINQPDVPLLVASTTLPFSVYGMDIQGNIAYLQIGSDFTSYDISNPANPILLDSISLSVGTQLKDITVSGRYAYVPGTGVGVQIVDISNPSNLVLAGTMEMTDHIAPVSVAISGKYAYVTDEIDASISIYDNQSFETSALVSASAKLGSLDILQSALIGRDLSVDGNLFVNTGISLDGTMFVRASSTAPAARFVNTAPTSTNTWGAYIDQLLVGAESSATGTANYSMVLSYASSASFGGLCIDDTATGATCPSNVGASIMADGAVISNAFDLAEIYSVTGTHEIGDVLTLYSSSTATVQSSEGIQYDSKIIGVASENPGFVLGWGGGAKVALAGRVPVKISMNNGPIQIGDALTSSDVPGHAMKATKPGMILGYALENASATGTVELFVNVSYWAALALGEDGSIRVDNNGNVSVMNDLMIGGRLFPSLKGGGIQTDWYLFVNVDDPTSTYISTNADGWMSMDTYDFAERYYSPDELEPGDLVIVSQSGSMHVQRSWNEDDMLLGIVSTRPAFIAGRPATSTYPIALSGRVPTKVSTINGAIKAGDPLAPTSIPGVAAKAVQSGPIVGLALEDYDLPQIDKIEVYVNPSYWVNEQEASSSTTVVSQTVVSQSKQGFATIVAGSTKVRIEFPSLGAYPNVQVTPRGSVSGGWWTDSYSDTGFEIMLGSVEDHDVIFAWRVEPTSGSDVMRMSDGTYSVVDPLTGAPVGLSATTTTNVIEEPVVQNTIESTSSTTQIIPEIAPETSP